MKPSEALRIGATKRPQATGDMFYGDRDHAVSSCALGAIVEGYFPDISDFFPTTERYSWGRDAEEMTLIAGAMELRNSIQEKFSLLGRVRDVQCPSCIKQEQTMESLVTHLNDDHFWTREQIADYLEAQGL